MHGKDNDKNDGNRAPFDFCWEKVKEFKRLPLPVIVMPITDTELQLQIESARYMEQVWKDILVGDALLGSVGTLGAFGLLGGGQLLRRQLQSLLFPQMCPHLRIRICPLKRRIPRNHV